VVRDGSIGNQFLYTLVGRLVGIVSRCITAKETSSFCNHGAQIVLIFAYHLVMGADFGAKVICVVWNVVVDVLQDLLCLFLVLSAEFQFLLHGLLQLIQMSVHIKVGSLCALGHGTSHFGFYSTRISMLEAIETYLLDKVIHRHEHDVHVSADGVLIGQTALHGSHITNGHTIQAH
jgi:hypothetical protein